MENSLYQTGVRVMVDKYLEEKSKEVRDYGEYWSASSAGYCMRKNIFDRLKVTPTNSDARKTRVFEVGHIFHGWIQDITKSAGVSVSQEGELQDEVLMIRGHYDDIIKTDNGLILYDYKTAHSRSFTYKKGKGMSYFHKMQLGTYMKTLREIKEYKDLAEGRICSISKDDLRMDETQLLWNQGLEETVAGYWTTLNEYWNAKKIPACTCHEHEGGFMAKDKYNPYYFQGESCSLTWYKLWKEGKHQEYIKKEG